MKRLFIDMFNLKSGHDYEKIQNNKKVATRLEC